MRKNPKRMRRQNLDYPKMPAKSVSSFPYVSAVFHADITDSRIKWGRGYTKRRKLPNLNLIIILFQSALRLWVDFQPPDAPAKLLGIEILPLVTNRKTGETAFNGIDLTEAYNRGAEWTLWMAQIFNCKKAYMLKMSPACDPRDGIAARMLAKNSITVIGI
jgi:hypothetical protein